MFIYSNVASANGYHYQQYPRSCNAIAKIAKNVNGRMMAIA